MKKFRIKGNLRGILGVVVIVALTIGIIALLASIFGSTTKDISSSSFAVGGLDAGGAFRETDKSLYSKEAFCCQGLKIERAFESKSRYEVYYYREDLSFIGSTDIITEQTYEKGTTFPNAMYARIVITPQLDADEKLSFLNKLSYASEFKVTVNSDQTFEAPTVSMQANVKGDYNNQETYLGSYYHSVLNDAPFVLANVELSGKTVKQLSIPISGVKNHYEESKLTVYVVEKVTTGSTVSFKKVAAHELKVAEGTFSSSVTGEIKADGTNDHGSPVNDANWLTWDVNIMLKDNQTLAFGDPSDTAYFSYRKNNELTQYYVYNTVFAEPNSITAVEVFVDIKVLE